MFDLQQTKGAALEEVVRQMPVAVCIAEAPSGKIILVNEQARQMLERNLGRSMPPDLGEIGDYSDLRVFHPDRRPVEMEEWPLVRAIGSGEEVRDEEYAYPLADGTELTVRCDSSPIYDDEGRIVAEMMIMHHITERKQAEETLRQSEEHLRFVLSAGGLGSWKLDLTAGELESSETCKGNFGLPPDADLSYETLLSMIHPDDRDPMRGAVEAAIATGGDYEADYRITTPGGEVRWVAARGRVVYAPDGAPSSMAGITLDITKRKRDEERLLESSCRIEEILESVTDAFFAMDADWRFTYLNGRALRFASQVAGEEFTREGLLGRTPWETLPAIVGTSIEGEYRRAVREQRTAVFEYPYPGGGPIFEVHAYPSEQGLSIYFRDITERKQAEEEIETRTQQQAVVAGLGLRALTGNDLRSLMDEAVASVARTLGIEYTKVVELLPGGEELLLRAGLGWREGLVGNVTESADLYSQAGYTLLSNEPVVMEDLSAETRFSPSWFLREHGVVSGMYVVVHGREGPFGVLGAYTASHRTFSKDDVNFLQAVANVLAAAIERRESEHRLHEVREAERSRMARDLHDEALQDLTYALAEAQHVQAISAEERLDRRLGHLVAALQRVGPQLRAAIYDLRLGAEQDRPFHELLEYLVELHRAMAPRESDIRLDLYNGVLEGPLGETGRELLRIIGEALTNARRHSEARNVLVSVWSSEDEEQLYAEVSDDGRGFDPAQEEPSAGEGRGMGTQGMRERARSLGADLKIESEPGKGTKVRFELALKKDREEPEEEVRILLVEDHVAVREAVASAFGREAGFVIAGQASSLAEARQMLAAEPQIDVAVVDLGLPDGYGGDLIKELREANPQAQTLVLSASLDRAEIARAVESGAAGVMHKTAHLDEVVDAVRRLRRGETLLPLEEVVGLLRFAGSRRTEEYEARQAIERLTPREREVLRALAEGLDSEGIAQKLHISIRTERNHMSSILSKLGVHSQLQALVFAVRYGVVEIS